MENENKPPESDITAKAAKLFLFWAAALVVLVMVFKDWEDSRFNPNREPERHISDRGEVEVVLIRNQYGHYVVDGEINGHSVTFLLDTGATSISVPEALADKIGLHKGFAYDVSTANGTIQVFATELDSVSIAGLTQYSVRAGINPYSSEHDEVLLGMSFLKHLELIQKGNTLTLRQ